MIRFPNAKINIGLNITGKRDDGFHNLETVFYPINICDALEILPSHSETFIEFSSGGDIVPGKPEDNLCLRAANKLKELFPALPNVKIHLHKEIPRGAGMGGGSADASAVLIILKGMFSLDISRDKLNEIALELGSDCPFFLHNKPCEARGRGEILSSKDLDLSAFELLVVNPRIHVDTGKAFQSFQMSDYSKPDSLYKISPENINEWRASVTNDFEKVIFPEYPEIKEIKEKLYHAGAVYSSMSGSGSTVYGIFEKDKVPDIKFPSHYFSRKV